MSYLENIGLPGPSTLRQTLTNAEDPYQAIREFQETNEIQLSSLPPALRFLDLQGVRRMEFRLTVQEELQRKLLTTIADYKFEGKKSNSKAETILSKAFPLVQVPTIRPIVLLLLKSVPQVPKKYLKSILQNPELYSAVDVSVKRQLWDMDEGLFFREVLTVFAEYVDKKQAILDSPDITLSTFLAESTKDRRLFQPVRLLLNMVGNNVKLYDKLLQNLRSEFAETKNSHFCSLRAELLMSIHDEEIQELLKLDPCHKFAWCLDACIREKHLDSRQAKELLAVLDKGRKGQEQIIADLAMIANDPHAVNFLASLAVKMFNAWSSHESMTREGQGLQLVLRLLNLGLSAHEMLDSERFKEPPLNPLVLTKFLPLLLQDQKDYVTENSAEEGEIVDSADKVDAPQRPLPPDLVVFAQTEPLCTLILWYHLLDAVSKRDRNALVRLLPVFSRNPNQMVFESPLLVPFVANLMQHLPDAFSSPKICSAVFDEFLLISETAKSQSLKLLAAVVVRMPKPYVKAVMEKLVPWSEAPGAYKQAYDLIMSRIEIASPPMAEPAEEARN